jgi:hypothetical protein
VGCDWRPKKERKEIFSCHYGCVSSAMYARSGVLTTDSLITWIIWIFLCRGFHIFSSNEISPRRCAQWCQQEEPVSQEGLYPQEEQDAGVCVPSRLLNNICSENMDPLFDIVAFLVSVQSQQTNHIKGRNWIRLILEHVCIASFGVSSLSKSHDDAECSHAHICFLSLGGPTLCCPW